mmetsp:Transcript_1804/g.4100  ORF Transcript_1804/g.4100 Transcript_1804/m.4100 type:complete len:353 (-) Transcript_1804:117-1175(-)
MSTTPAPLISGPHSLASTITKDDSYSFERNPRDVRTYSSSFRSRPYTTDYAEDRMGWRTGEPGDPTNIVRTVQHDPRLFSGMTKRSAVRWKDRSHRATTAGIKDFYDLGNSIRPDMAVAIERSPIKYSLFSASAIKATPSAIIAAPQEPVNYSEHTLARSTPYDDYDDESSGRAASADPKSIKGGSWDRGDRFLSEGHPLSMFHKYTCRNELTESRRGTIATAVEESEMRYRVMHTRTDRSRIIDMGSARPGGRTEKCAPLSEFYSEAEKGLDFRHLSISRSVETCALNYRSSLASTLDRFPGKEKKDDPGDAALDLNKAHRRQLILEARIQHVRSGRQMSKTMKKILNIRG